MAPKVAKRRIETDAPAPVTPVVETPAPMAKNSFFAAVHSTTVKQPTTTNGKDKMKVLSPSDALRKTVDELVEWKRKLKEAEAEKDSREAEVINYVLPIQDEDGFGHNYQKSYRVQGVDQVVTFVSSDKFSNVKPEDIEPVKNLLGERFSELVEEKVAVTLKDEVMTNVELQKDLMDLIGAENFGKFFQSKVSYVATEGLDRKLFSLPRKVVFSLRVFLKKSKPSIK